MNGYMTKDRLMIADQPEVGPRIPIEQEVHAEI